MADNQQLILCVDEDSLFNQCHYGNILGEYYCSKHVPSYDVVLRPVQHSGDILCKVCESA